MIDYFLMGHPLQGLRSRFAQKARTAMFCRFMEIMRPDEHSTILDLGVTPEQSLPESNLFEQLYPYKQNLTAASIEDAEFLEQKYPGLKFKRIQRGTLPFADNEFDIVFSSAVIEHVGDMLSQKAFVGEILRVSRRFFIITPNRQFPFECHTFLPFIHWLPQPAHQAILRVLGLTFWSRTENLNLLSPAGFVDLFPACRSVKLHRYFLCGMPSNLVVYGEK